MRVEKAKTVALVILVTSSLLMSGWLWLGVGGAALAPPTPLGAERATRLEGPSLRELTAPERMIIRRAGGAVYAYPGSTVYERIWEDGRLAALVVAASEERIQRQELDPDELQRLREETVEIVLPVRLSWSSWLLLWGGSGIRGVGPAVDRLSIALQDPTRVVAWAAGEREVVTMRLPVVPDYVARLLGDAELPAGLPARPLQVSSEVSLLSGIYVPDIPSVPRVICRTARVDPEEMAASFFVDRSLVRRIVEKDGAVIYTDGQQGLRVYPSGMLEYCAALPQADPGLPQLGAALRQLCDFASTHGRCPPGCFLAQVSIMGGLPAHQGYSFVFGMRCAGLPVLGPRAALEATVGPYGVRTYVRYLRELEVHQSRLPLILAAEEAVHLALEVTENPHAQVVDVYLAYYDPSAPTWERQLRVVWVVAFAGGRTVLVDARDGTIWDGGPR